MKYISILLIAVSIVAALTFAGSEKGDLRIAYVDIAKATDGYVKMKQLNEEYKKDVAFYKEKLQKLEKEIENLKKSGASQEEINKKQEELIQKKRLYEGLIQQEYQPKIQQILQEVVQKAKDFAKLMGYDVLLTNQGAVYASERVDVTDEFIEYLNSGGK